MNINRYSREPRRTLHKKVRCSITSILLVSIILLLVSCQGPGEAPQELAQATPGFHVPDGFFIDAATPPGMVSYPMFATFDNSGRLFVIESSGKTTSTEDVLKTPTFRILLLEDQDEDGVFDKRKVFADSLPYPMGGTFYRGSFYATAPPDLIRLTDSNDDGVADKKEVILTGWTLNHNAATLSGPFFGPDGWMYMCDARRGFNITTKEGTQLTGKGARIWRCRPDGSGLEWLSGGGFDNTIEMIFMPSGETIGTMTYFTDPADGFRDALMHWVEGGVYPKPYPVIEEDRLKLTGPLMPVMTKLPRVSPAGLMRYKGTGFGKDYQGNLFSAEFNTGRIMRHIISEDGATFRTIDEPFMKSDNPELHPTDVLEDADGSLLVVNTGGWFIAGCPLSVVAKTDVQGGIFRIRKKDAPRTADPWARATRFEEMSVTQLAALFRDHFSPIVREKAMEEIILHGEQAIAPLTTLVTSADGEEQRTSAVFALYRIGTPEALASARNGLGDKSAMVKRAAARVAGLARDRRAVSQLLEQLKDTNLQVRRQAATALGQIGDATAVASLLAVSAQAGDRFVEHAITHSLIALGETSALVKALEHPEENVRRIALVALDQVDASPLKKNDIVPFLESKDSALQHTGIWVASHHPAWSDVVIGFVKSQIKMDMTPVERETLKGLLITFSGNAAVQKFIASELNASAATAEQKLLLIDVMSQAKGKEFPAAWVRPLESLLLEHNPAMRSAALDLIQSRRIVALDEKLDAIIRDARTPPAFRMKALGARVMFRESLAAEEFNTVMAFLGEANEPYVRQMAARLLGQAKLNDTQLMTLARDFIPEAEIYLLPALVTPFEGSNSPEVGRALVAALTASSDRLDNLSVESLRKILGPYPASVATSAEPLMKALTEKQSSRLAALENVESTLGRGDVGEGRKLFFGKALCSTCHAVTGRGGTFGPDLTNIGEIRSRHDILEAILYPGASLAREYETSRVVTTSTTYVGIIREQLPETVVVETGPGASVRLNRGEVSAIEAGDNSLMPPGLDKQLSAEELADLMAYLTTLPDGMGHLKNGL